MTRFHAGHGDHGLIFEPMTAAHIKAIDLGADFMAFQAVRADPGMPETLAQWHGYAGMIGRRPVVVGGLIPRWDSCAQIWMAASPRLRPRHFLAVGLRARALVARAHIAGCSRVEAYIRTDRPAAARWIEHLGFVREGVMRKFGMGREDHYLYAAIDDTAPATPARGGL